MNDLKAIFILIAGAFVPAFFCADALGAHDERPAQLASVLETFPMWYADKATEDRTARKARLLMLATAQVHAVDAVMCKGEYNVAGCVQKFHADPIELYALLLTAGWWETRYNRRIHAGNCNKDECDGGNARGVYQVHRNGTYPDEIWDRAEGDDWEGTLAATQAAAFSMASAWKACRHRRRGLKGVWGAYGRGKCDASYPGSIHRYRWALRRRATLEEIMK